MTEESVDERCAQIHARLDAMLGEEEALMDELEQLGDMTYYVSNLDVEDMREHISALVRDSRDRDAAQANLKAAMETANRVAEERDALRARFARAGALLGRWISLHEKPQPDCVPHTPEECRAWGFSDCALAQETRAAIAPDPEAE